MEQQFANMAYVIGADHHTTLALIRCLYKSRCPYQLIIHDANPTANHKINKSRYGKKAVIFPEDEARIINWLLQQNTDQKGIIIPGSDFSALLIDRHAEELEDKYFLPGFKGRPGLMAKLMDKMEQKCFADRHGIPMAASWPVVQKEDGSYVIPENLLYPCIVKPEISAFGSKSSIFVAHTHDELVAGLEKLSGAVLIQQYLTKRYETCAYGVMEEEAPFFRGGVIKKLHESSNGSTIYAECVDNEPSNDTAELVCRILWEEGYRGLYDFEMLVCDDGVYLNEINFRNSGNGYALLDNGIPAAIIWCNSVLGISNKQYCESIEVGSRHINDFFEMQNIKRLKISLIGALWNIVSAKSRAVFDWNDLQGSWAFYSKIILGKLKQIRKKRGA